MGKILTLILIVAGLCGCTTGRALSEKEEFWVSDAVALGTPSVYYCKTNKEPSGLVKPRCYKAEMLTPQPQ